MNARNVLPILAAAAAFCIPRIAGAELPYYNAHEYERLGRVVNFQPYNLQLDRGPHMSLHNGTVIRPTGLTLANGMPVRVVGHDNRDGTFEADEIDLLPPGRLQYLRSFGRE